MSLANSILLTFSPRKCVMVCTSGDYGTLSYPVFSDFVNASLLVVHHGRQSAPSSIPASALAVLAAGPLSYFSALASSSFCLFQLYLTSPVLVLNSFGVFTDSFHRVSHSIGFYWRFGGSPSFSPVLWFNFPTLLGNPLGLAWCFFLDARMGGVQSVRDPRVA